MPAAWLAAAVHPVVFDPPAVTAARAVVAVRAWHRHGATPAALLALLRAFPDAAAAGMAGAPARALFRVLHALYVLAPGTPLAAQAYDHALRLPPRWPQLTAGVLAWAEGVDAAVGAPAGRACLRHVLGDLLAQLVKKTNAELLLHLPEVTLPARWAGPGPAGGPLLTRCPVAGSICGCWSARRWCRPSSRAATWRACTACCSSRTFAPAATGRPALSSST